MASLDAVRARFARNEGLPFSFATDTGRSCGSVTPFSPASIPSPPGRPSGAQSVHGANSGPMKETTIATHRRHLQAALSWAVSTGMLPKVPAFHMPKRAKGRTLMRGRPITAEELKRMLAQVPVVRPRDSHAWIYYLNGLWLSGLRLEESIILSWDEDSPFSMDLCGRQEWPGCPMQEWPACQQ